MNFTILKKMFGEILFRQWLTIKFQLMSIHNKGSLIYINIFYLDRAIVIDCFYLIMSKPPCFQFSFEILKSDVIQHSRVTWLKNFFLINLSCHLVLWPWTSIILLITSFLISSNAFNCISLCLCASFKSILGCMVVLKDFTWNSINQLIWRMFYCVYFGCPIGPQSFW